MQVHVKNNLGLILICAYFYIATIGGLLFGEMFIFFLTLGTLLLVVVFDPLNNLSWSVRAFIGGGLK